MNSLGFRAISGVVAVTVVMGLLLFAVAGTLHYWEGWVYLAVFFVASLLTTLDLMQRDPALLERRLRAGPTAERERPQKIIMVAASLGFVALIVVPALDHRFGWSAMPLSLVVAGNVLAAWGFYLVLRVYRANSYAAATIQVTGGQTVISTGPYAVVRHPMYAGSFPMLVGMTLALGSWWGLLVILLFAPVLVWRLLHEERFLAANLTGYADYCRKVRWRLVPGVF